MLLWFFGLTVAAPAAAASTPRCMVPFEGCASRLDGFFGSPMDVPELVPAILAACKRDAQRYRACSAQASIPDRDTILARVAYIDEVVAAALLKLHRGAEAIVYQDEGRRLATQLMNNPRLTEDERAIMRFIISGEPWFPERSALEKFIADNEFVVAFVIAASWPVFLALLVAAAALLAPRRALH